MISLKNITSLDGHALPFSSQLFKNISGVQLPGITAETQKVTMELLKKNQDNFHLFFNTEAGFHNHFVHHLLAAYSCGASPDLMRRIYENNAPSQKPKPPSKMTITRENWTEHLGNKDLWTDYLNFFDKIIKEDGMQKAFETYTFHPEMFTRLHEGVFHPIIHIGYGLEFQLPIILSEGLAQTAIHENRLKDLLSEDLLSYKGTGKKKAMDVINEVLKDERFDNFIKHTDKLKYKKLLEQKLDTVKDIAKSWYIPDTEEGVREAARELYDVCALVYGATAIRPDKEKIELDFILMHGLTSMYFVYITLQYTEDLERRRRLLRAHFTNIIARFIAAGRPKLHIDLLKNYTPKTLKEEPNPWLDLISNSLLEDKEAHVIKVVRALLKAENEWGSGTDNLYVKIGLLTYEGFKAFDWGEDIGFDEEWE